MKKVRGVGGVIATGKNRSTETNLSHYYFIHQWLLMHWPDFEPKPPGLRHGGLVVRVDGS